MADDNNRIAKDGTKTSYLDKGKKKNAQACRALHGPNSPKCPGTPKGSNKDTNGNNRN